MQLQAGHHTVLQPGSLQSPASAIREGGQACAARASLSPGTLELLGGDAASAHVAHYHLGLPVT